MLNFLAANSVDEIIEIPLFLCADSEYNKPWFPLIPGLIIFSIIRSVLFLMIALVIIASLGQLQSIFRSIAIAFSPFD